MMSNEEFDRKMEFIVNQQAQFTVDIQKLNEAQKELQKSQKATADSLDELKNLTYEGFKLTAERFDVVARNFEVVAEKFSHTDVKINALIASQMQTEEFVRNIGAKVDRHLTEDHNGGPKPNNP